MIAVKFVSGNWGGSVNRDCFLSFYVNWPAY